MAPLAGYRPRGLMLKGTRASVATRRPSRNSPGHRGGWDP